jgi:pilus assembly protein CpaB
MALIERIKKSANKNFIMLFVSLSLGVAGVYFSKQFIEDRINFYRAQMDVKDELIEVVVPKRKLLRGEILTSDLIALRSYPKKYTNTHAINNLNYEVAIGQRISFDTDQGQPLLWAHLEGGVTPTFSGKIDDGLRALTVPVGEVNSISGFLQPNDIVDLLLTYQKSGGEQKIFPIIQNLHVMATGVKTVTDKTGRSSKKRYSTITVQVSSEEAKKIILAQDVGKITATLRHPDDNVAISTKAMTVDDLLGKKKVKKKTVARKKVRIKKGIEYIIGGI